MGRTEARLTDCGIYELSDLTGIGWLEEVSNFGNPKIASRGYITAGTLIPITASIRVNSRLMTATVARRNSFRLSSCSLRIG